MRAHEECLACDLATGKRPLPGGRIAEVDGWVVEHAVAPLGLGTLIVKPLRHVLHVADLGDGESAALGPLLRRVSAAVTELVRPEQVYVCLWSHAQGRPGHLHFVVQPVRKADMERFGAFGPSLQMAMFLKDERPATDDIEAFCARVRPLLTQPARVRPSLGQ
ncbi:HIT family protein [Actinomadura gamaensis]|uniref:HIT family protein n=1 Tax=Actinomadura gamaensis TaxID=1763541 RepID=A0ABV9U4W6_9ACTN